MKVVTVEQMRAMDREAIEVFGIPGSVLMENAGRAVAEVICREYGPLEGKSVPIFCGAGNNGGDGFVIARYLRLAGAQATCWLAGSPDALKADARLHYELALKVGVPVAPLDAGAANLAGAACCVDALLGTGAKGVPREGYAEAIRLLNGSGLPIVAVDIPSGVDADTGAIPGEAARAAHTITFACPKLGLLTFPGAERVGRLHIADIGFPWEQASVESSARLLTGQEIRLALKKRHPDSNKGDYGHVAVIAGSRGMVGAPALTARAAQRAGAGLVTVLTAASAQAAVAIKLDEQMTRALPEQDGALAAGAFAEIVRFAEKADVFCIGPGLTTAPETVSLACRLVSELDAPVVLDADGLNALALQPEAARKRSESVGSPLVLTPHPGEAARLLGTSIAEVQSDRIGAVRKLAERYHAVAVLKGRHTLIADPGGQIAINATGNPGMATGGSGDALTGILGGLLAGQAASRKKEPAEAGPTTLQCVGAGVFIHGMAGDLAAAQYGEAGLVAGDIIEATPAALRLLEGGA